MTTRPAFATTYDAHDPALLHGVLPYVDYLEITPDSIARQRQGRHEIQPAILADLKSVQTEVQFIVHGVGLSIGSWEGYSEDYLDLVDQLLAQIPVAWHSEHLGYLKVGGENLNAMLAVPRTEDMLELLIPRIRRLHQRYAMPFLLENIVHLLPDYPPQFSDAAFLNILVAETGCGLILDTYNLECDAHNYGFDVDAFLGELNFDAVREIHIAGGTEHRGYKLDIHSGRVANSTLSLTRQALARAPNVRALTYEILPEAVAVHGAAMVIDEVARLTNYFNLQKNENQNVTRNRPAPDQVGAAVVAG